MRARPANDESETDLRQEMDKMARQIIRDAAKEPLDIRLDAFKTLTAYWSAAAKLGSKQTTEETGGPNLRDMRARVAAAGREAE